MKFRSKNTERLDSTLQTVISRYAEQLQDNPDSFVFLALADALRKNKMLDAAMEVCEEGVQRHPEYATARLALAQIYAEANRLTEAIAQLDLVLRDNQDNLLANRLRQELLDRLSAPEEPSESASETPARSPDSVGIDAAQCASVDSQAAPDAPPALRARRVATHASKSPGVAFRHPAAAASKRIAPRTGGQGASSPDDPRAQVERVLESWLAVIAQRKHVAS